MDVLAPTLIIGLGGNGSKIVSQVAKNTNEEQRRYIRFVVFDTDANDLRELKEHGYIGKTVQTSKKMTVGEYLENDQHARENWFPVNRILCRKALSEGAGQVRAISRLALDTAIHSGAITPLHEAIDELYRLTGHAVDQAMRVIIVSSLAGGTGSGLLLPVALYTRNYLVSHYQQNSAIVRGFFVMPEVFYHVIHGETERNNLRSNAYATLRELDAFMMKGDGTLEEKYKDLAYEVPRVGSDEYETYDVLPYDFCFLFDGQNLSGRKLTSFTEYMEHAANCIYAQSVSVMSARSNSSEDNVVRSLCAGGGRNRYCGAGSSRLYYPMEDVNRYIAIRWASEGVSDDWLLIDREYERDCESKRLLRNQGVMVENSDRGTFYISKIDSLCTTHTPFALSIHSQCFNHDSQTGNETEPRWELYLQSLYDFIGQNATANLMDANDKDKKASSAVANLRKRGVRKKNFSDTLHTLTIFDSVARKQADLTARTLAQTLFDTNKDKNLASGIEPQALEYWLFKENANGRMIHPNAVRYFLYMLLERLGKDLQTEEDAFKSNTDSYAHFQTSPLSSFEDYKDKRFDQLIGKMNERPGKFGALLADELEKYGENIRKYRKLRVKIEVMRTANQFIQTLAKSYERFFDAFAYSIGTMKSDLDEIEKRYVNDDGHAVRYVCCDQEALRITAKKCVYVGSVNDLPGELCSELYKAVRRHALTDAEQATQEDRLDKATQKKMEEDNQNYFRNVFENVLMKYWRDEVMKSYRSQIDLDIIQALKKEAEYKNILQPEDVERYMVDVLDSVKRLAEPFIEAPLGEEPRILPSCAYSAKLENESATPESKEFIRSKLKDYGGNGDANMSKNEFVFYQAIYGLRANRLSKFAPPHSSQTTQHPGGEYYSAYYDLVSRLTPDTMKCPVITPHLDRRWHLIKYMPDLDEGSQRQQERDIISGVVQGLLFEVILFEQRSRNDAHCRYSVQFGEASSYGFLVPNGTECDQFFELFDALSINLPYLRQILELCQSEMQNERNRRQVSLRESRLMVRLNQFSVPQFELEGAQPHSILEIPLFYRLSISKSTYDQRFAETMPDTVMSILKELVAYYTDADERDFEFGNILQEQYQRFLHNVAIREKTEPNLSKDPLVTLIRRCVQKELDSAELNMPDACPAQETPQPQDAQA